MKLLFIQGGSRVQQTSNNNFYVDTSFNNEIWKRYKSYCNDLTVILRKTSTIVEEKALNKKLNKIDTKLINLKLLPDLYMPKINCFNVKLRKKVKKEIQENVRNSDRVIIRSVENYYTKIALYYCKKYKKKYLIEVTGYGFDTFWNHGILGKIKSIPVEIQMKKAIKQAPYVIYVTKNALQKKYPCYNNTLGCSDSEIITSYEIIEKRMQKINNKKNSKLILGTAATIDVKFKGQLDVIKAIYFLKKHGINIFEYQLVGNGEGNHLKQAIKKYGLENEVKILGVKPHDQIYDWYDQLDIYIHPSYIEGLSRSILEAMSRGCFVIATDVGGNSELIDNKYLFKKKKYKQIANLLSNIKLDEIKNAGIENFKKSEMYSSEINDNIRDQFYLKFIKDNENMQNN